MNTTNNIASEDMENISDIVEVSAFRVGKEEYLIDLLRVREIIRPIPVTPVRQGPAFIEGVIDLRGVIIPMIDLRKRFKLPAEETASTRYIIAVVNGRSIGLIVDEATDILRIPRSTIREAPHILSGDNAPYFLGVCNFKGRLLTLLNVKKIVSSGASPEELSALENAMEAMG